MELYYNFINQVLPFAWLNSNFMKNALLAILMLAPLFGFLSTMIVSNRMAFFSDSLGHGAFAGIAIGIFLGTNQPLVSLIIFSIIFACGITYIKHHSSESTDTIIGVFSAAGVAIGLISMSHGGNFRMYANYFIGDILSISQVELLYLAITLVIILTLWALLFNKLLLLSINDNFARSRGVNTLAIEMIFATAVAVVVAVAIQWVGLLVINALLILPGAGARNIAHNARQYHFYAVLIALVSGIAGMIISYYGNIATGATISLLAAIIFFITFALKRN